MKDKAVILSFHYTVSAWESSKLNFELMRVFVGLLIFKLLVNPGKMRFSWINEVFYIFPLEKKCLSRSKGFLVCSMTFHFGLHNQAAKWNFVLAKKEQVYVL